MSSKSSHNQESWKPAGFKLLNAEGREKVRARKLTILAAQAKAHREAEEEDQCCELEFFRYKLHDHLDAHTQDEFFFHILRLGLTCTQMSTTQLAKEVEHLSAGLTGNEIAKWLNGKKPAHEVILHVLGFLDTKAEKMLTVLAKARKVAGTGIEAQAPTPTSEPAAVAPTPTIEAT